MFGLGTTELILILVIVVIFFGAGKLPEVGAGIAKGIKNFKKNLNEEKEEKKADEIIEAESTRAIETKPEAKSAQSEKEKTAANG